MFFCNTIFNFIQHYSKFCAERISRLSAADLLKGKGFIRLPGLYLKRRCVATIFTTAALKNVYGLLLGFERSAADNIEQNVAQRKIGHT